MTDTVYDLSLLIRRAPESIRDDLGYAIEALAGQDTARDAIAWCHGWTNSTMRSEYERGFYARAAAILTAALPDLPAKAPEKKPQEPPDAAYSRSVAKADRLYARTRRRAG